jgi:hypothetical protein
MNEPNLHRNNAAEWAMVAMIYPFRLALRAFFCVSSRLRG